MILVYQQKNVRGGMWLPPLVIGRGPKKFGAVMAEIQRNLPAVFKSEVRATYAMSDFQRALADYESGMTAGKSLFRDGPYLIIPASILASSRVIPQ